jgi:hypothetical protein
MVIEAIQLFDSHETRMRIKSLTTKQCRETYYCMNLKHFKTKTQMTSLLTVHTLLRIFHLLFKSRFNSIYGTHIEMKRIHRFRNKKCLNFLK